MQKLTPERVSDYAFQIVVNNTVDYIYYLHEPYMNTYSWVFTLMKLSILIKEK